MMDERVFEFKPGDPIPEWDLRHRLPTDRAVGPECRDTATVFRINSTYMDVTDQPYMERQWTAGGVLTGCFGVFCMLTTAFAINVLYPAKGFAETVLLMNIILVISGGGFAFFSIKFGRDEFFALRRRPIRFNRETKTIYALRRRRFGGKPGDGDIVWEVPWNEESIFCIHRGAGSNERVYHIRHYTVDRDQKVVSAFAIGREWDGRNIEGLLSQWNYWCWYMNHGPAELPQPALFFAEHEDVRETFLFCLYSFGFQAGPLIRILGMPCTLVMTAFRLLALSTCRAPVWPVSVEEVSKIAPDDPYNQPRPETPVGWAQHALACNAGTYPWNPRKEMRDWRGEPDGAKNAELWAMEIPPSTATKRPKKKPVKPALMP